MLTHTFTFAMTCICFIALKYVGERTEKLIMSHGYIQLHMYSVVS